ncbi:MAG: Rha family transcriptional regulator [Clostridium paraputrificum]
MENLKHKHREGITVGYRDNKLVTIDSREVAEMLGKEHSYVLEMIQGREGKLGVIPVLENANLAVSNYFIPSTYKAGTREYKCYLVTKMGCELLGNKQQGEKGILFTAKYVERFNQMEQELKGQILNKSKSDNSIKEKEIEARLKNDRAREANILLKISNNPNLSKEYVQVLQSKATEIVTGEKLLPLPVAERKTYSATEIGNELGITSTKVGILANKYNLKTEEYGKLFHDKSRYSSKEVESFRYYDNIIPVLAEILSKA